MRTIYDNGYEGTRNRVYKMSGRYSGKSAAEKMLAGNFLKRQKRKRRSISLAVIIFLVILLVTAFGTDSIHTVLENKAADRASIAVHLQENECAIYYNPGGTMDSEEDESHLRAQYDALKEELSSHPDTEGVKEWYADMFCCNLGTSFFSEEYWNAYRNIAEGDTFTAGFYSPEEEKVQDISFIISAYADNDKLSDYVTVEGEWPWLVMGQDVVQQIAKKRGYSHISEMMTEELHIKLSGENQKLLEYLGKVAEENGNIQFVRGNESEIQKSMMGTIADIVDILLICFVLLTSGIYLMNFKNTIGGRMADRRMEFATLQSVGMTRAQIKKMLLFECGGMLLEASAAAVLISSVLIWLVRKVLSSLFGHLALEVPYLLISYWQWCLQWGRCFC